VSRNGCKRLVNPRPYTVGSITETFNHYPHIGVPLPAMGYSEQQLKDPEATINKTDCDAVLVATPIDLSRVTNIKKPNTRVYYELQEIGTPNLGEILLEFGKVHNLLMKEKT